MNIENPSSSVNMHVQRLATSLSSAAAEPSFPQSKSQSPTASATPAASFITCPIKTAPKEAILLTPALACGAVLIRSFRFSILIRQVR